MEVGTEDRVESNDRWMGSTEERKSSGITRGKTARDNKLWNMYNDTLSKGFRPLSKLFSPKQK